MPLKWVRNEKNVPDRMGSILNFLMILVVLWLGLIQNSINQSLLNLEETEKSPVLSVQMKNVHTDEHGNLIADMLLGNRGSVPIDGIRYDIRFAFENGGGGVGIRPKDGLDDIFLEPGIEVKRQIKIAAFSKENLEKAPFPTIKETHLKITYKRHADDKEKCIMVSDVPNFSSTNLLRDCSKFENPPQPSSGEWRFVENNKEE